MNITKEGSLFIIQEETGGKSYYEKVYKGSFIWPGGASGPTALVGIDIGYYSVTEVNDIFKPLTSPDELKLIQAGRGKKGDEAKEYVAKLKNISFTWDEAIQVFELFTLPKFTKLTERVFPGVNDLAPDAQAAILSLVFNRGASIKGPTRTEMAEIKRLIPSKDYEAISTQIKSMKRLWSKGSGLLGRRDKEAALVANCV
jgi:hypothetical protein